MAGIDLVALSRDVESRLGVPPLIALNGKAAVTADWPRGPWDEPEAWRDLLRTHTGNIGIVTGCRPDRTGTGLLVLDFDIYKPQGLISYEAAQEVGWVIDTPTVRTGSGGFHQLLRYDPARWVVRSKDMKDKPIPGMDDVFPGGFEIKAEGGYVVRYDDWVDGLSLDLVDVAPAPDSLLELIGIPIDPETGNPATVTHGPWSKYDPDLVHDATAEAVAVLTEHFGGHDPIIVRNGHEPSVELVRPGKPASGGRSATVGWLKPGLVKVFTDGWDPFTQGQVYDLAELRGMAGMVTEPVLTVPTLTLPDGYRLWRPEDGHVPPPTLGAAAYHGPIGEYLRLLEGQTEAHPAAIGAHLLAGIATMVGRVPMYSAGSITHRANLFAAVVGMSSTGAKGVAQADANRLLRKIDPHFHQHHTLAGLGSGEMLVYEVRDPDPNDPDDAGAVKERIIQNAELSGTFKVCAREGSILGDHLRLAFDGEPLRHSTRTHGIVTASNHHISIVGSITPMELLKLMDDVSRANGFGNRFLYLWSEMGDLLPFGGDVNDGQVGELAGVISGRLTLLEKRAGPLGHVVYRVDPDARDTWAEFYRRSRLGRGDGFTAEMTARTVAHAARIALVFAVLDGATTIQADHIRAADAWVTYAGHTVEKVFTRGLSGLSGILLAAIRDAGPDGLTLTDQMALFSRNRTKDELDTARGSLEKRNLITTWKQPGIGRPVHRSIAIWPYRGSTNKRNYELRGTG